MLEKLKRVLERWEHGERLDKDGLAELEAEFESWLEMELKEITELAESGDGNAALGRLTRLNAFASSAAVVKPSLASALSAKVGAFRTAIEHVARSLGAVDFSITLGVPVALSFTLTFVVTPAKATGTAPPDVV